jgi:hypothetical protein
LGDKSLVRQKLIGPLSYKNWIAALSGQTGRWIHEFPLFTDGPHFVGEFTEGFGPYQVINTVHYNPNVMRPALILRIQNHLEFESPDMNKTRYESYHAGSEEDEIASLMSLCLGIRLKAGVASRIFGMDDDPKGRPTGQWFSADPILVQTRSSSSRKILKCNLEQLFLPKQVNIITTLPALSAEDAAALVRAARMYQEAAWVAEATPELSWIMLVSAVETIANQWRTETTTSIDKMRASRPELELILRKYGGANEDDLVLQVAESIAPYMGATNTFIDFIIEFLPSPPSIRPPIFAQHSWETQALKKTLNKIYKYRSRALHGGHPFPAPMCEPPVGVGENGELAEIPIGLATSMRGSTWLLKDTPILLHTFEYIVRNVILNWWKSVVPQSN